MSIAIKFENYDINLKTYLKIKTFLYNPYVSWSPIGGTSATTGELKKGGTPGKLKGATP